MSSFYDRPVPHTPQRLQLKPVQRPPDHHAMLQINNGGGGQCVGSVASTANHAHRHVVNPVPANTSNTANSPTEDMPKQPLQPLSLRRVVKFSIQPHVVTLGVALCCILNTVLSVATPSTITPPLGTQWGCFLYLWLLITVVQLVTHSVYLCTSTARATSLLHLTVVALSAGLLPRSMFARSVWIAPCLCTVLVSYQSYIFCILYTTLHNAWMYVFVGVIFVLMPMTQLVNIGVVDNTALGAATLWSAISIYTLYAFALANSRKTVLVDIIIGTSPTTQLQE